MNYEELRKEIRDMGTLGNKARQTKLWVLLKEELTTLGHWRNHPRGDSSKGYAKGWGKNKRQETL